MPGFDGSGPNGAGPMTGGGRGFCVIPYTGLRYARGRGRGRGYAGRGFGRGFFGRGRGQAMSYYGPDIYEPTKADLEQEASVLREELRGLEEQIRSMGQNNSK